MQQAALTIEWRNRSRVAFECRKARFEHFRIIVLAHGLARSARLLGAAEDTLDELRGVDGQFDRGVEPNPLGGKHGLQRARLRQRAGKSVEDKAATRVRLFDPVVDDANDDIVRHQGPGLHHRLRLEPDRRSCRDRCAQHIAR